MNQSQAKALERLSDQLIIEVERDELSTSVKPQPPLDWASHFERQAPLAVEIGSGTGDAIVAMAGAHPDWNFIGFEVYWAGVASTLIKIEADKLSNVRIIVADGVAGMRHLFSNASLHRLCTFFPDPWHKARHHKRRLIDADFARLAAERCEPGAEWRIATDWDDYAEWIVDELAGVDAWERADVGRFPERPITRFEKRGLSAGRPIHDLCYVRQP